MAQNNTIDDLLFGELSIKDPASDQAINENIPPRDFNVGSSDMTSLVAKCLEEADLLSMDSMLLANRRVQQEQEKYIKEIQEHFDIIGLRFEDLAPTAQADINFLANAAAKLGVSEPTLPKILMALSELNNKHFHHNLVSLTMEDEEQRLAELHQSQLTIQFQLKRLQEEQKSKIAQLTEDAAQAREKHEFYTKKCSQYMDSVHACLAALQQCDFSDALSHQSLMEKRKKVDEKQAKLKSLKTELEAFHDLPPNIDAARQELETCKEELRRLDELITAKASESGPYY